MPTILKSDVFEEWIDNLRDRAGAAQVLRRLARLERGNSGRVAPVGEGVSELKIDFGPGYRVYFGQRGEELVIILGGGDKSRGREWLKVTGPERLASLGGRATAQGSRSTRVGGKGIQRRKFKHTTER